VLLVLFSTELFAAMACPEKSGIETFKLWFD
jgi:hypothetical protein